MPAIGPKYFAISVMAAWRCLTSCSGFACANTLSGAARTSAPATMRVFLIYQSPRLGILWLTTVAPDYFSALAQSRSVFRHRLDFSLAHPGRDAAHHAVRVVRACTILESTQLSGHVLGVLAGDTRVLRRD